MTLRDRADAAQTRLRAALGEPPPRDRPRSLLADTECDDTPEPAAASLLSPAVRATTDPRRSGVIALTGLALLAAMTAGVFALRARPRPTPVARQPVRVDAGSASPTSTPVRMLVVDVTGEVRRPGLQRLPAGSRVADAIAAAGGAKPPATTAGLNLARKLVDGEQILVGAAPRASAPAPPVASAAATRSPDDPLDLNAATLSDLDALSGVGPVLAQRIITWRDEHGGFTSVDQLREVEGIGDRKFASLREQVTV